MVPGERHRKRVEESYVVLSNRRKAVGFSFFSFLFRSSDEEKEFI